MKFNESHTATGINISEKLLAVLQEWDIADKIHVAVRDNASNMKSTFANSEIDSAGCLAHTLQLVIKSEIFVQASVKTLIEKCRTLSSFAEKSIKFYNELNLQQKL